MSSYKYLTPLMLLCATVLLISCHGSSLRKQDVVDLLHTSGAYPQVINHDVYCGSTDVAKQAQGSGLVEQGLITVTLPTIETVGKPMIAFTEKSAPYLMDTPDLSKSIDVQRVKIATEDVHEVTGIKMIEENMAEVTYTTTLGELTPFEILLVEKPVTPRELRTRFTFDGKDWVWSKKIESVNPR